MNLFQPYLEIISHSFLVVAPAILLIASPWVPESPRWLVVNDRCDKALEILKKLHKKPEDPEEIFAREEYLQIRCQLEMEATNPTGLWAMFKQPHNRKRFFSGIFVQ